MTDNQDYAEQMLQELDYCKNLKNSAKKFSKRPSDRVVSKFEKKAIKSKRKIFNLAYTKVTPSNAENYSPNQKN